MVFKPLSTRSGLDFPNQFHVSILLIKLGIFFCTASVAQNRALFFAVNDYSVNSDFGNLKNPIGDAEAIAKELEEMYGFEIHLFKNPTKEKIFSVLEDWQTQSFQKDEQLFVFFSGHGTFWHFASKGYFVPYGDQTGYNNYIDLTTLGNIVTKIQSEHILLAIDACYSGTIDQEIAFKGSGFARPYENNEIRRNRIISLQLKYNSRLLITSGGKERTPDGADHSPFASAILSGLRNTYTSGDGLFLFSDLKAQLARVTPLPHIGSLEGHQDGGFVFQSTTDGVFNISFTSPEEESKFSSLEETKLFDSFETSVSDKDGNIYPAKRFKDGKIWMIENLNVNVQGAFCYEYKPLNCEEYGRLYTWEAAKEGCQSLGNEWRLPSDKEWQELLNLFGWVDGNSVEGDLVTNTALGELGSSRFNANLGGYFSGDEAFYALGINGNYWSRTEVGNNYVWYYIFVEPGEELRHYSSDKRPAYSVRCIKD